MHHHHSRALRIARRNYNAATRVVSGRKALYLRARESYLNPDIEFCIEHVEVAMGALWKALDVQLDCLSVLIAVEKMLEKA